MNATRSSNLSKAIDPFGQPRGELFEELSVDVGFVSLMQIDNTVIEGLFLFEGWSLMEQPTLCWMDLRR